MSQITISSKLLKDTQPNIDPSDFEFNFDPPLELGNQGFEVALFSFTTFNTARNIKTDDGNTKTYSMTWSSDSGANTFVVNIPDGNYSISDVYGLLKQSLELNGGFDSANGLYGIEINTNFATNKVDIFYNDSVGDGPFSLTLSDGMADFLGFPVGLIASSSSSSLVPNVNAGIDAWQIRCDLQRNSYDNGRASDILYSFVPTDVPPSFKIVVEPKHLFYSQVNKSIIYSVRLKLSDQNGRKIDLEGEDVTYTLSLRPIGVSNH